MEWVRLPVATVASTLTATGRALSVLVFSCLFVFLIRGKRISCLLRFTLLSLPFALCGGSVSIQAQLHLFLQPSQFVSALISGFVSTISILVQGLSFVGHHSMCWHRWDPASMIHPDTLYTSIAALPVQLVLCDGRSKWEASSQVFPWLLPARSMRKTHNRG